jgi:2,3-dihydroxybiphenyl 1,2-dioxygenase
MAEISALGYIVLNVSNLAQWETFATDVMGLQVAGRTNDSIGLRMDESEQRVLLERGTEDDVGALGWELDTLDELLVYVDGLRKKGLKITEADKTVTASRKAERVFFCLDPAGVRHEFFTGPALAPLSKPFQSKVLVSAFETGRLGFGHVFCVVKDYPAATKFALESLGMRLSDYIRDSETFPGTVDATFTHVATGRHHSYAMGTVPFPFPKKMHHMMFQVKSLDDVGLAFDRVCKANVPVMMGIGHHPNDHMVSFYCATPSGFGVEFGWGGLVIDDETWNICTYSQLDDWGHKFPEQK